ncbi:hypothetical protein KHP62_00400 [Rhodobacteraceae bacterium NNCM2]|nr:hypothetical protein [Coraliihabitans acroporae]
MGVLATLWGSSYLPTKIALIAASVSVAALFLQANFNSIGACTVLAWGQQFIDSRLASVLNSASQIFFFNTLTVTRHKEVGGRLRRAARGRNRL